MNEAQTAAAVLGHNFPDSQWYKDAYALLQSGGTAPREDSGSWISQTWKKTVIQRGGLMPEQASQIGQTDCRPGQAKREPGSQKGRPFDILQFA